MNFHTRKWVKPEDLNPNGTLFGGSLLRWIDEEAAIYAIVQLGNQRVADLDGVGVLGRLEDFSDRRGLQRGDLIGEGVIHGGIRPFGGIITYCITKSHGLQGV